MILARGIPGNKPRRQSRIGRMLGRYPRHWPNAGPSSVLPGTGWRVGGGGDVVIARLSVSPWPLRAWENLVMRAPPPVWSQTLIGGTRYSISLRKYPLCPLITCTGMKAPLDFVVPLNCQLVFYVI